MDWLCALHQVWLHLEEIHLIQTDQTVCLSKHRVNVSLLLENTLLFWCFECFTRHWCYMKTTMNIIRITTHDSHQPDWKAILRLHHWSISHNAWQNASQTLIGELGPIRIPDLQHDQRSLLLSVLLIYVTYTPSKQQQRILTQMWNPSHLSCERNNNSKLTICHLGH